jgi:hypothetical protein
VAYEGEELFACHAKFYNWISTYLVVVSGDSWNPCGHAILNPGGQMGSYIHTAGGRIHKPLAMNEAGYRRYLRENKKRELSRILVPLKNFSGAQRKLEELTSKPWSWGILPHNCVTFVTEILRAGGANGHILSNCPALESWR